MPELRLFGDYMSEQTEWIRRVVLVLDERKVRHALVGGHAVSYYARPRVTVDVDFLMPARSMAGLGRALERAGFLVAMHGDVLRAWDRGADPAADEPVVDFVPAEHNRAQTEALRTAERVTYNGIALRIVTRPALVALKFLSSTSRTRAHLDRLQDATDIGRVVKASWTDGDAREARRLVELWNPAAGAELDRLVDDLLHDRPITI